MREYVGLSFVVLACTYRLFVEEYECEFIYAHTAERMYTRRFCNMLMILAYSHTHTL